MVTRRLCDALLRLAARRWPADLSADLHAEWQAELHVLAEQGRPLPMLAYAASLAVSRPTAEPVLDRSAVSRPVLRTAAFVLLTPVAGVVAMIAGFLLMNAAVYRLAHLMVPGDYDPMFLQEPLATTFTGVSAGGLALAARRFGRRSATSAPLLLATVLAVPCGLVALLLVSLGGNADKVWRVLPELVLWTAGVVLVLWLTARAAARGRARRAWWLGLLGAFAVADLVVVLTVVNHSMPATVVDGGYVDGVARAWALLWLPALFAGTSLGLPGPTEWEIAQVGDITEFTPYLYLVFTPYLVAYAIAAARRVQAPATPSESASAAVSDAASASGSGSGSAAGTGVSA